MQLTEQDIPTAMINLEDKTFQITTETSFDKLAGSIEEFGMIHPPILLPGKSGYRVVSGFRRISACRFLKLSTLPAKVCPFDMDQRTCVHLAISDNSLQRPLNLIETSRALVLLSSVYSGKELCSAAGELGLPENLSIIRKISQLSGFEPVIQNAVLSSALSLSMAIDLGQSEQSCGTKLTRLFEYLKIGLNKQREIFSLIQEISLREHLTIEAVLDDSEIRHILDHEKWDHPQKAVKFRRYLKQRRYPQITSWETHMTNLVESLHLDAGIQLILPRDFEGTTFCFQLSFKTTDELRHHVASLAKVSSSHVIDDIVNPYGTLLG